MAKIIKDESRTFGEYLLIPGLTTKNHNTKNVSLKTPLAKFKKGEVSSLYLNIPVVSSIMQAVSNDTLAIALAREGGMAFIFGSQSIESQAEMVKRVKKFKAGFVTSDSNLTENAKMIDALTLSKKTGHSIIAITENGDANSILKGLIDVNNFPDEILSTESPISNYYTPASELIVKEDGITLKDANNVIYENKIKCLPIVDSQYNLVSFVFKKDKDLHASYPNELVDDQKRLCVGAGINSMDYKERVPKLIAAGVDAICIDSSDGYSEWQSDTIKWVKETYGDKVIIGAGNVVDGKSFEYLAKAGADFVKVGIGGGSICITREQKGIGRGQASSILDVSNMRDEYYDKTGIYIPLCSDGGISQDYHLTIALALGADFVMMGRYFARFDESPGKLIRRNGSFIKEYWAEGSNRARNWQRYDLGEKQELSFEEGVDAYVPYAGSLKDQLSQTLLKIKSTMCNCGVLTLEELKQNSQLTIVSNLSLRENGAHDVHVKGTEEQMWL